MVGGSARNRHGIVGGSPFSDQTIGKELVKGLTQ
jgi:hypothetical protein